MSKKGDTAKKVLFFIAFIFIGGLFGFFVGKYFGENPEAIYFPKNLVWLLLLSILPIYLLAIGVHEGGHALAGIAQNFDFRMYVVGPFIFEKEAEKWKFKWNKSFNLSGGLVLCLPKDEFNLTKRFSIFIGGGPVASLISAIISFCLYTLIDGTDQAHSLLHNVIALILMVYTIFSAFIFIATIIPISIGGFHSDGARFIRVNKGGDISRLEILVLTIFSKISAGTRPKDYNMDELKEAKQLSNKLRDNFEVYFDGFLFQNAFDKNEIENAENYLNDYLSNVEKVPKAFHGSLWLDAAFFYAYGKEDMVKANEYFAKYKPSPMLPKAQVFATEAALLKLQNNTNEMNLKIEKALSEIPAMLDSGLGLAMKERLMEMKR